EVQPFKAGAFAALRGLDVEIVPVGLAYDPGVEFMDPSFVEHVMRVAARPKTYCSVSIGQPRLASGKPQELASSLRGEVQALVQVARTYWGQHAR
ncbi:MAG TPA: hypothetical protein VI299_08160, partial [Polyangiales bacterium]